MVLVLDKWDTMQENLSTGVCKQKKGADQPAHGLSLISTFAILLLDSIISKLATRKI